MNDVCIHLIWFYSEGILKHDMVMLNFFPNLEGEETRFATAELLFVMDRSGKYINKVINVLINNYMTDFSAIFWKERRRGLQLQNYFLSWTDQVSSC